MARKKNKKKKGKPFKRIMRAMVGDLAMRKGLTEPQAWTRASGILQDWKGEELAERIRKFLAPFDAPTQARFDIEMTRLRGIKHPTRFKKQTLVLLATVYDFGYRHGLAKQGEPNA